MMKPLSKAYRISHYSVRHKISFGQIIDKTKGSLQGFSVSKLLSKTKPVSLQTITVPPTEVEDNIRDRFIPFSRYTIIREIIQDGQIIKPNEREKFQNLCIGLDHAIHSRYFTVLQELKSLFEPINPDNETITISKNKNRPLNRKDKLDNEFWLFQRLQPVMERAGFHEMSRSDIEIVLKEKPTTEGVIVAVEPLQYDTLKMWVLGRESLRLQNSSSLLTKWRENFWSLFGFEKSSKYSFKRVVVGVRQKVEDSVHLKMFSDIPSSHLQQLLPIHSVRMSRWDKYIITSLFGIGSSALFAKAIAVYFDFALHWSWILTGGAIVLAMRLHTVHYERCANFMKRLNHLLYRNSLAHNRALLTLLVDRAEDEEFKGALLIYSRLLLNDSLNTSSTTQKSMTPIQIEKNVEDWLRLTSGIHKQMLNDFQFECEFSLSVLEALGLVVKETDGSYRAIDLTTAIACLPVSNRDNWFTGHNPSRDQLGFLKHDDVTSDD